MLVSPFTFYRGAALLMAADLARTPSSGVYVQACGDAHLSNFGAFATPERLLAFDINDFDESYPAPFEWDVARLAASIVVAGRWWRAGDWRRYRLPPALVGAPLLLFQLLLTILEPAQLFAACGWLSGSG